MPARRILLLGLGTALSVAPAAAQEMTPGWHFGRMWEGHGGWMFFGPLTMVIFVAALVVLAILAVRWVSGTTPRGAPSPKTPLDVLKERFARGEINKAEFEESRRLLHG